MPNVKHPYKGVAGLNTPEKIVPRVYKRIIIEYEDNTYFF